MQTLPTFQISELCASILLKHGVPEESAHIVVNEAIANELDGYPSHGVMRITDHVKAILSGHIDPFAVPSVYQENLGWIVDAHNGLGALAIKKITETINTQLSDQGVVIVGLRNAGRIGRLAKIGHDIAESGNIVFGFINFRGAGKRVAPIGSLLPILSTNPFLFACPRGRSDIFVLDMSTSVVAEGKVRSHFLQNKPLPSDSWLHDLTGAPSTDPSGLYAQPPTAILSPLGGMETGYKGFGLAMMVEIMASMLTGGEFANETRGPGGNGALFIGLRPDYFGQTPAEFSQKVEFFASYCEQTPMAQGFEPIRVSGSKKLKASQSANLNIPQQVYDALLQMKGE